MVTPRIRCTVIESVGDPEGSVDALARGSKELPPWADPFIARLVAKYRLRAALDDSLRFLQHEASHHLAQADENARFAKTSAPRFTMPPGGD
jgi:hypothetical protein